MSVRTYRDVARIYSDMDGVVADYEAYCDLHGYDYKTAKLIPGLYASLPLMPGARHGILSLLALGFDVFFLTKPPSKNPYAAAEKIMWARKNFPELRDQVIITPDKGAVGTIRDFLIDDHPEWANASNFPGTVIHFGQHPTPNWDAIVARMSELVIA